MTLRGRLLVGAGLGVALALAVAGAAVFAWTRASLYAQFDEALAARAQALAALVELDGDRIEPEMDPAGLPGEVFELWARGAVQLRSTGLGAHELQASDGIIKITLPDGRPARQITIRALARIEPDEAPRPQPEITLVLARATREVDGTVARVAQVLAGAGVLGTLLALAILAVAVRVGLAPLRALAQAIAEAQLSTRITLAGVPGELRPVVARLDELLARLGLAFERERALTAELAHEMRTPLAGIRATIEVALDRERSGERYRGALADVLAIVVDTERVVEAMLTLARLDAGAVRARSAPLDLDELVRGLAGPAAARAEARGARLATHLVPVTRTSDGEMLRVVIANLLDNAVTYVDSGGSIDVTLTRDVLVVANTGCTLPASAAARVFERFWRGDEARPTGAHAGLGLALCKQLVELLGGTISVEISDGRFLASVRLPEDAA